MRFSSGTWLRLFLVLLGASAIPILGAGLVIGSWLEAAARDDARVRMGSLADLGAALILQRVEQAEQTLAMVGRAVGPHVDARPSRLSGSAALHPTGAPAGDPLQQALEHLLGDASPFLDVQVYAGGDAPELLGQRLDPDLAMVQSRIPDLDQYQRAQTVENVGSSAVQIPLQNRLWRSEEVERDFGFPTLRLSAPTLSAGLPNGAAVGYLDLRVLPADLAPIAEAGCAASLTDGSDAPLGAVGPEPLPSQASEHVRRSVGFGNWTLDVHMPESQILAAAAGTRWRVLGWTLAAAVLAALASLLLSQRISRPVRRLTAAADAVTAGRLDARAGVTGNDEFGRLGTAFDRMARSVEDLDRARSSFVATVSHELRTPLTSMKLTLDNVRDGIAGPVPAGIQASVDRVHGDCGRLLGLVDDLLQMTRIDAGMESASSGELDLGQCARDVAAELQPIAQRAGRTLTVDGNGTAWTDPNIVRRILTNLVDNGIKYSTAPGRVAVEVAGAAVHVVSDGGGLDPERHRAAFARGDDGPGTGLGLFLVDRLAELLGGHVDYATLEGPRTRVSLRLPAARPSTGG